MENKVKQCPELPFFGASYPDAICCDGYLWDLDSYDSEVGGNVSSSIHIQAEWMDKNTG